MKTIRDYRLVMSGVRIALMALLIPLILISCERPIEDDPRDETLTLTASTDTLRCLPRLGEQTALILTWSAGTNHGTGSAISYTIDINYADSSFESGLHYEVGRTMDRTLHFTHRQLVDTLPVWFPDMKADSLYDMRMRVRAKVLMTGEEQVSEVVPIVLLRATPVPDLYLVGDAMPNGWDLSKATVMINDVDKPSHYTWTGRLRKGEFKPVCSLEEWIPCYVRDTTSVDSTKMIYRETEDSYPDLKWLVPASGKYTIDIDVEALTIAITALEISEQYEHIYMIGDATPGGWSWDNITAMDHPEINVFTYEGPLSAGQIKFPTELKSDWSGEMLYAPTADCTASENGTFVAHTGDPDNKWVIPTAGTWSITINIKDTTISFVKL